LKSKQIPIRIVET